jgi:hypothetical protein
MHRILYSLLLVTSYRNPNYPANFPSSPSIIAEENGWKSLAIIYQRDAQGKQITFDNPNESRGDSWNGGTVVLPVEDGQEEMILVTDHKLTNYYNPDEPLDKFTWVDRLTVVGKVIESKKLENYLNPENIACSWGIKNESSIYRLSPDGALYKDGTLITSFGPPKTVRFDCSDISINNDKSILVNGRYYFNWQTQSWQDVKPSGVEDYNYYIKSFGNIGNLFGSGVELITDDQNLNVLRFRVVYQEYDVISSQFTTVSTSEIDPETNVFNSKNFFKIAENSEQIYIAAHDISYSVMGLYTANKLSNTLEVKAENVVLPKNAPGDQGQLIVIGSGDVFYVLSDGGLEVRGDTKVYLLDNSLKFVDITPKRVEEDAEINSVFMLGDHLYMGLSNSFSINTEEWVVVKQLVKYDPTK